MAKRFFKSYENYAGYVYILTNSCFPYLKIGFTTRTPNERARELSEGSGVPAPYEVAHYVFTHKCGLLEDRVHIALDDKRAKNAREFFDVPLEEAIELLNRLFRELEAEIGSDPKQTKIEDIKLKLSKMKDEAYIAKKWTAFKKIKATISYLNHKSYSIETKYKKATEIEEKCRHWKGFNE